MFESRGCKTSFHPFAQKFSKRLVGRNLSPGQITGCSIMVVYAVWDGVAGVRFPAPRQNVKSPRIYPWAFYIFRWGIEKLLSQNMSLRNIMAKRSTVRVTKDSLQELYTFRIFFILQNNLGRSCKSVPRFITPLPDKKSSELFVHNMDS